MIVETGHADRPARISGQRGARLMWNNPQELLADLQRRFGFSPRRVLSREQVFAFDLQLFPLGDIIVRREDRAESAVRKLNPRCALPHQADPTVQTV